MRADVYLVQNRYTDSRTCAARLISEGKVLIDGRTVAKASEDISDSEHDVRITEQDRYVGRGGLKLEAALEQFGIDVRGKRCIDVGASTGGFTDCLLQNGAASVYAVDSGRDQLHPKLRADGRVTNIEGFNAREMSKEDFGVFDIAVMDVSFISQTLIHPALSLVLTDGAIYVSLIKPQFESGRGALGKNGIVKDPKDRENAILRVLESAYLNGFEAKALIRSPIEGGDGNREFLACFVKKGESARKCNIDENYIKKISR